MARRLKPECLNFRGLDSLLRSTPHFIKILRAITPINPDMPIDVSMTLHVFRVSLILRLKYSLKSQNPPSFTCPNIRLPAPIANTINSGLTDPPVTNGRTMPAVVIPATVAEPTQNRRTVAISHPRNRGERED